MSKSFIRPRAQHTTSGWRVDGGGWRCYSRAGGEISSEILSQLGPAAKDSIIGPEPPEAGQPEPIARFAPERAEAEMLNTLNSIGTPIMDLPPEYRGENGRILSFDEMYAKDSTLTPGEYGRAVNVAINHTWVRFPGHSLQGPLRRCHRRQDSGPKEEMTKILTGAVAVILSIVLGAGCAPRTEPLRRMAPGLQELHNRVDW